MFNTEGPALYTITVFHDRPTEPDAILRVIDAEIDALAARPVDAETLRVARTKMRSSLLDAVEGSLGFGRADLLASFSLFFDDPGRINEIAGRFAAVTPELVRKTAREYLRKENRTILIAQPGAAQ
jgi:predicted Zn-dependent peptidase